MKPRPGTKFLHNLLLQSKFLINLIFCLKISSDWGSLISVGSVCHNFFRNISDGVYAIQSCLSFRLGKAVAFTKVIWYIFLLKYLCHESWVYVMHCFIDFNQEQL